MSNILVNDAETNTQNRLVKCLETAGFDVIITENGLVSVNLKDEQLSPNTASNKLNTQESIFPSIPRLREVFEFIELNYHQSISLKSVACAVGYSAAYLTDLVAKMTGKPLHHWIIERRLAAARRLLLETNASIEQIATEVGYQNINHFYCQFRTYHQNTPNAWRKQQRCQLKYEV